jgi:hypothetical protein
MLQLKQRPQDPHSNILLHKWKWNFFGMAFIVIVPGLHHNHHYRGNTKGSNNDLPFIVKHNLGVSLFCVYTMTRFILDCNFPRSNWNHRLRGYYRTGLEWMKYPYHLVCSKITPYSSDVMLEIFPFDSPWIKKNRSILTRKAEMFSLEGNSKVQKELWTCSCNKFFTLFLLLIYLLRLLVI